ncbi:hypothetical protein IHN63_00440 [Deinococcus sp. 6YEL10]|uniref:hypothetical protein n=1 Tax=Deinococcus sp. 6YEL10 TaxID=2745870 RepID=UPI001E4D5A82|nr:hypothetical protein [Deinococcus sp. 6YEL10]MCD0159767.1 hypothetical protein [Deinococcus sp. 6YEL10]
MATGIAYPLAYSPSRGVKIETDPLLKKIQNVRLALVSPPNYYPLTSRSGNPLFTMLQNTPLSLMVPALVIFYCKEAIEPFVRGVRVRDLGEGSDVTSDHRTGALQILLSIEFTDLESSTVVVFTPDVENPATSTFRLMETAGYE